MDLVDVLSKRLLRDEQLATLHAWYVSDVLVHFHVVVVSTPLVGHELASGALKNGHLVVDPHVVSCEQVSCIDMRK